MYNMFSCIYSSQVQFQLLCQFSTDHVGLQIMIKLGFLLRRHPNAPYCEIFPVTFELEVGLKDIAIYVKNKKPAQADTGDAETATAQDVSQMLEVQKQHNMFKLISFDTLNKY